LEIKYPTGFLSVIALQAPAAGALQQRVIPIDLNIHFWEREEKA